MRTQRRVLVFDPDRLTPALFAPFSDLEVEFHRDEEAAQEDLATGGYDAAVVAFERDVAGARGAEFVRRALAAGVRAPVILAGRSVDDAAREAALAAGAVTCVDLAAGANTLGWAIRFAQVDPSGNGSRSALLLHDLSSFLAHEGKNALAGIGGAVQVIGDRMAEDSPERSICGEIQARLTEFNATLDTITFLLRAPRPLVRSRVALRRMIEAAAAEVPACPIVVSGGDLAIDGDPGQLKRLFASLFESAAGAASDAAPLEVSIRQAGETCEVELHDALPAADITRVRELFLTTVAQRVAEAHGGSLQITCGTNGPGLRVTARLPLAKNGAGQ